MSCFHITVKVVTSKIQGPSTHTGTGQIPPVPTRELPLETPNLSMLQRFRLPEPSTQPAPDTRCHNGRTRGKRDPPTDLECRHKRRSNAIQRVSLRTQRKKGEVSLALSYDPRTKRHILLKRGPLDRGLTCLGMRGGGRNGCCFSSLASRGLFFLNQAFDAGFH
jgi:hypothetical protein